MASQRGYFSGIATILRDDTRVWAHGVGVDGTVEGHSPVPLGWSDCAWDYEQTLGYKHVTFGKADYAWASLMEDEVYGWFYDEVGLHPWDLSDEAEDWDIAPCRRRYSRDWGYEPGPAPLPALTAADLSNLARDDSVKAYEKERKAEARRQQKADEDEERKKTVNEERSNIRAMTRAARDTILAKVESGFEGRARVEIRKGNQMLRWEYRVEDGQAFIIYKNTGWVPLRDRR